MSYLFRRCLGLGLQRLAGALTGKLGREGDRAERRGDALLQTESAHTQHHRQLAARREGAHTAFRPLGHTALGRPGPRTAQ